MLYGLCFFVYIKKDNIYKGITEDAEIRFNNSNYELDRPSPKGKNKKVIALIKDELGGKSMEEFVGLRAKTCSYLVDNGSKDKKAKSTKVHVIKKLKLKDYKNCLKGTQLENKINQLEKVLEKANNKFIKKQQTNIKNISNI